MVFNFLNPKSKLELMVLFYVLFALQYCILHILSYTINLIKLRIYLYLKIFCVISSARRSFYYRWFGIRYIWPSIIFVVDLKSFFDTYLNFWEKSTEKVMDFYFQNEIESSNIQH